MQRLSTIPFMFALVVGSITATATTQSKYYSVSPVYDSKDGQSNYPFPGFFGGFRQQILLSESRLAGLKGQDILGLWIRRDLHKTESLQGGAIELEVRISPATKSPELANPSFASNIASTPALVFLGRVVVPTSPSLGSSVSPWDSSNSVKVVFQTKYSYTGGDVCIDVRARPVPGLEPEFWFIDYEMSRTYDGSSTDIGKSCSPVASLAGRTLYADDSLLQIGSTMRLSAKGRPGSTPILILGASPIPGGHDLTAMMAPGCYQYVQAGLLTRLAYTASARAGRPSFLKFHARIPSDKSLLGVSVFTQIADDETGMPRSQWSNGAGLTTSNGLNLKISSRSPDLGMSVVTSNPIDASTPMPASGKVDVSMAPILRLIY